MDAFRYAETGKNPPREIADVSYIDRFGVMAVYGRPVLSCNEIQRMILAENIVSAYRGRKNSDNWAKWASDNPADARLLSEVEKDINGAD